MLDLTPEGKIYFRSLPPSSQSALKLSNLTFRTVEDLKTYLNDNQVRADDVLYKQFPEPAIPSNAALDPLDSANP